MTGFDMCKGGALPGIRTDSKNAFREVEYSEPCFWGVHVDKSNFASDLSPVGHRGTMPHSVYRRQLI